MFKYIGVIGSIGIALAILAFVSVAIWAATGITWVGNVAAVAGGLAYVVMGTAAFCGSWCICNWRKWR